MEEADDTAAALAGIAKQESFFRSIGMPVCLGELSCGKQNQNVKTENITEGMQKIEDLLDKVIVAFQRQLDALFESDVVDITADIRVMEQMMASEGLTNKKDFA